MKDKRQNQLPVKIQFRTLKELTPILQNHFYKMEEGTVPNSIYEARITLTQKPEIYRTKKENRRLVHLTKVIFLSHS